jgi:hypothetical protein
MLDGILSVDSGDFDSDVQSGFESGSTVVYKETSSAYSGFVAAAIEGVLVAAMDG